MNAKGTLTSKEWIACDKVVVRNQIRWHPPLTLSKSVASHSKTLKPVASVCPTLPVESTALHQTFASSKKKVDKEVQTDNNHSTVFHIEDIIRAQFSLESISHNSLHSSFSDDKVDDKESLQKSLELQQKINADLKNLLVSALSGNLNVAQQLIDLINNNANLSSQSKDLAHQKAILQEAANTSEIVADVWKTKCIASHVVAGEAAKHATVSGHQAHLSRHALAHLLGERAQIRRYLCQTVSLLYHYCNKNDIKLNKSINQACNTLSLTSLCFDLALAISANATSVQPLCCSSDTLGEELAQYVLTRVDSNKNECIKCNPISPISSNVSDDTSTALLSTIPLMETTETDNLFRKTLETFQSTREENSNSELFFCPKCVGDILAI
ncbi:hypothetical protein EWB00_010873 [Schistosoma japonicum]|uniref:SJCHGC05883 protein n=1 Tax=Schistosoma japonicum TaxID=6182 RepID=Q5D8I6_SCHJA|nr:SJCHGC05883 protein [Schistosoma japonicum]KAH8854965.1 hypothetical protein KSF78_0001865 [Schistosoma japonicum]TNN17677.1 hypothetical protein EWB00_010873 [Schistosoma japonicum]